MKSATLMPMKNTLALALVLLLAACSSQPTRDEQQIPPAVDAIAQAEDTAIEQPAPNNPAPKDLPQTPAPPPETPADAPSASPTPEPPVDPAAPGPQPDPQIATEGNPCAHTRRSHEPLLDKTTRRLQQTVCSAALWFDGLFGERNLRQINAARGSHGRVELATSYSEFRGSDFRVRFNARVDLTNVKERLNAFVGRDTEDTFVRDRSEGFALRARFPQLEDRDETIAGLGYSLPENYRFKTEFRTGVRFSGIRTPKLFSQVRFSANAYSDDDNLINLRATPFVNTNDGFGFTSSVDMSHVVSNTQLFRWSNVGTITEKTDGLDWRSSVIFYQALAHRKRAIAYETFVRGITGAPVPLAEYGVQAIYRQPASKDRMWANLILGYSFPQEDPLLEREGSYSAVISLELPFGGEKVE